MSTIIDFGYLDFGFALAQCQHNLARRRQYRLRRLQVLDQQLQRRLAVTGSVLIAVAVRAEGKSGRETTKAWSSSDHWMIIPYLLTMQRLQLAKYAIHIAHLIRFGIITITALDHDCVLAGR